MSRFEWETDVRGPVALVTLRGELDLMATADLEQELDRLGDEPGLDVVAVDLRNLEYLDSSGLRLVAITAQRLGECGRRLVLVRGHQEIQRVFEITRMTERLEFVDAPDHVFS